MYIRLWLFAVCALLLILFPGTGAPGDPAIIMLRIRNMWLIVFYRNENYNSKYTKDDYNKRKVKCGLYNLT